MKGEQSSNIALTRRNFLKLTGVTGLSFMIGGLNIARATQPALRTEPADLRSIIFVGVHPFNEASDHSTWREIFTEYHLQFLDRTTAFNDVGFHLDRGHVERAHTLGLLTASYFSQNPLELPDWAFSQRYYAHLQEGQRWKNPDGTIAKDPYESNASRNVLGEIMRGSGGDRVVMSEHSPYWLDYQKKSIEWALNHGLNAMDIDLVGAVPFSNTKGGDFSGWALESFRKYLSECHSPSTLATWGIQDVSQFNVRDYILNHWIAGAQRKQHGDGEPFFNTEPLDLPLSDPIVREFHKFQYQTHIEYFRSLVQYAHALGERQGTFVPYFGNLIIGHAPDLLSTANPTVIVGQVMDIIQIETRPAVPPAGRLTTTYKLAWAMGNYRKPVWSLHNPFYGASDEPTLPSGDSLITLLKLYIAETYAAGAIPEIDLGGWPGVPNPRGLFLLEGQPIPELTRYIDFVSQNRDHLINIQPLSNVALVYSIPTFLWRDVPLFGIWYDWERAAFAGYARALEKAHIQYDVLIFGHPELWDDKEMLDRLSQYSVVILPYISCISDEQVRALTDYVYAGGKLITVGSFTRWPDRTEDYVLRDSPALLQLSWNTGRGQVISVPIEIARSYFENVLRQGRQDQSNFNRLVAPLGDETRFISVSAPSSVGVNAWKQGRRLILHLLNYDYDVNSDSISSAKNIKISISYKKLDLPQPTSICLLSPDLNSSKELSFSKGKGTISFSVHQLKVWDIVVISSS